MQVVAGLLREGGGAEDEALVVPQDLKLVADVIGMVAARRQVQAEVGAEEGRAELGIGSGGSRLNEDTPLPPTEPDWTLSSHPAL